MSLEYLHFNIFGLALSDLATDPGSISERISSVYSNYFYKVNWIKDGVLIPKEYQEDFFALKKIFVVDVKNIADNRRKEYLQANPWDKDPERTLKYLCSTKLILSTIHWRKSRKAAELIAELYFGLGRSIKNDIL